MRPACKACLHAQLRDALAVANDAHRLRAFLALPCAAVVRWAPIARAPCCTCCATRLSSPARSSRSMAAAC